MQLWKDLEVLGMVLKTMVMFHRFLVYLVSLAQPKPNSTKNPLRTKLIDVFLPLKWNTVLKSTWLWIWHYFFLFSTDQDKRNVTQLGFFHVRSTYKFLYIPLFWTKSILNYLISRFGPSSRRLGVRSLLWLDWLNFAYTRESLNLRWQSTKVWNSGTESGMRKMNECSAALCSLGLSNGGKEPQFSSICMMNYLCLINMLHLIVCLTMLVTYLTQVVPAKWSWFLGRRTKDE